MTQRQKVNIPNLERLTLRELKREYFQGLSLSTDSFNSLTQRPIEQVVSFLSSLGFGTWRITGRPFPKTWREMKQPPANLLIPDINSSIYLTMAKGIVFGKKTKEVLELKKDVENSFVIGDYSLCSSKKEELNELYGVSLWSMEIDFLIQQFKNGLHGNRTALSSFASKCGNDLVALVANNSSLRMQPSISSREYHERHNALSVNPEGNEIPQYSLDYLRYRFLDQIPSSESSICNVLHFESRYSAIDQLLTLFNILERNHSVLSEDKHIEFIIRLAECLDDDWLKNILALITNGQEIFKSERDDIHRKLALMRFIGDYQKVLDIAIPMLRVDPSNFFLYELVASSCARAGISELPVIFNSNSVGATVLEYLQSWYSPTQNRIQTVEELRKLARSLRSTRLGVGISSFVNIIDTNLAGFGHDVTYPSTAPCPLPTFALQYEDPEDSLRYIENYRSHVGNGPDIELIERYYNCTNYQESHFRGMLASDGLSFRFEAAANYRIGNYQKAVECLKHFRSLNKNNVNYYPDIIATEANSLLKVREYERAATLMVELYSLDSRLVPPTVLRKFVSLLEDDSFYPNSLSIAWPIIATHSLNDDQYKLPLDRIHDFVGDYLDANGKSKPTEYLASLEKTSDQDIVFLRDCCVPLILESSIWYESRREVLRERLELCTQLREKYDIDSDSIVKEISSLTKQLSVLELTSRIQRSKIYVDTASLMSKVEEAISEPISTLLTIRAFKNLDLRKGLRMLEMPDSESGRVVVVPIEEDLAGFIKIFETIKKEFLYSPENGFDANLSQRIRHGVLANEVRAVFDKFSLVTRKGKDGTYQSNKYWLSNLEAKEFDVVNELTYCFDSFSEDVDRTIQKVRDELIQIHSGNKPFGLFDFEYTEDELRQILKELPSFAEPDDVKELINDSLWQRTDECLENVRHEIQESLCKEFIDLVEGLNESVNEISNRSNLSGIGAFRTATTQAKTALTHAHKTISGWFYRDDLHEHISFQFNDLLGSIEQSLKRVGVSYNIKVTGDFNAKLRGEVFRPFWDMIMILIDNACTHSGLEKTTLHFHFTSTKENTSLKCQNTMNSTVLTESLREEIKTLNTLSLGKEHNIRKLREEGGSGIAKLHKIVRHDLHGELKNYCVDISLDDEDRFVVYIEIGGNYEDEDTPG